MFRSILHTFFDEPGGFAATGVRLQREENDLIIFWAKMGFVFADEAAIKYMLDSKGASGLKPCPLCKNVVAFDHGLVENGDMPALWEI